MRARHIATNLPNPHGIALDFILQVESPTIPVSIHKAHYLFSKTIEVTMGFFISLNRAILKIGYESSNIKLDYFNWLCLLSS